MNVERGDLHLGTQGWNYQSWRGPFYPDGTSPAEFLRLYSSAFDTVEVDSTFYATPQPGMIHGWAERTPSNFVFSLKMPNEITHERRLRECDAEAELFFERARELGPKLGAVLMQMGPDFSPLELPALAAFLPRLPKDIRVAIEFRQRGWIHDGILALLAEHNVALALVDGRWITRSAMLSLAENPTADFAYIRWMGPNRDIVDYSRIQYDRTRELESWCTVIQGMVTRVKTVYGYVNNHFAGHSPATVRQLQEKLGIAVVEPSALGDQLTLF